MIMPGLVGPTVKFPNKKLSERNAVKGCSKISTRKKNCIARKLTIFVSPVPGVPAARSIYANAASYALLVQSQKSAV